MFARTNELILFLIILPQICMGKLPSSIVPCHRNDSQLNTCIVTAVEKLRPFLAHGNLGDGYMTPPLEPLYLDNINLGKGNGQFNVIFSDMVVMGGSNFIINKLSANASNLAFDVALTLPRIDFTAKYLMRLNILLLNIQGKGDVKGYAENAKAVAKIRGTRLPQNGVEYVRFNKLHLKISVNVFKMRLDNLFNGDPVLGEIGNAIINDNRDLYLHEVIPGLETELSEKFLDIANNVLSETTYDEMFPM